MKLLKHTCPPWRIITAFLVFSVVFFTSTAAQASIVEIAITATINYVRDDGNRLEGNIHVNDIIMGTYTYEPATLDTNPSLQVGDYQHYASPYGMFLTVGGFEFKTNPANTNFLVEIVNNNAGIDGYLVRSYSNLPLSNGAGVDIISWQLADYSCTALSTDVLPVTAPVLTAWPSVNELQLDGGREGEYFIAATVTSAQLVPEPATLLLLGLGVVLLKRRN